MVQTWMRIRWLMDFRFCIFFVITLISALSRAADSVSFEREVLPLLEHRCNHCHHPDEMRGGLDLTRLSTILRGGDDQGPAVIPFNPGESPLIQMLTGDLKPRMPKKADPLPQEEIDLLARWIEAGAIDDTPKFKPEDIAFFEREIRPVLFERCFKCHAGEEAESGLQLSSRHGILLGGDRGPAALPGKPEQSLIISAIRHKDLKMPRGGDPLSATQIEALEEWIRRGLPWPSNQKVLTREKLFTISDADRNHWSFKPLPGDLPDSWSIDSTLAKRHSQQQLTPAEPAEAHTLLRRVSYDLIGYPPTGEEIDTYIEDCETLGHRAAFTKVVDRLMAMPQFGWRWGRHWLDYTRNGANGQPNRGPQFDTRRYAAWVADCFNEDRPWDWFARVHIAGDKMPAFDTDKDYSIDQALAAAVPLNGPRTFQEAGTETFVLMDKIDEGVEFLGRSLMGISMECARCHDHKFDPVSQRDYYALLGYFQSSWFAPVPMQTDSRSDADKAVAGHRQLTAEKARLHGFIRRQSLLLNTGGGGRTKAWYESRIPDLIPVDRRLREMELAIFRGELAEEKDPSLAKDLTTAIADLEQQLINYQPREYTGFGSLSGYQHFIRGHKSEPGLIRRATALGHTGLVDELEKQLTFWIEERERWIERSRFGGYAKADPEVEKLAKADERIKEIRAELSINPGQPWLDPQHHHLIVRADGGYRRAEDLKPLDDAATEAGLQFNRNNQDRVWMHPWFVGDSRLLLRGDVLTPGEIIPRGTPGFFGPSPATPDGSGRLQLAEWLTRPGSVQSALVARALVNRAWQNLFGEALCRTPKELGRLGETPELPEIIDGLAAGLIADGWSVKTLIRNILLSKTYQQSAVAATENDPQNRWFARQSVRRLQSEAIMNAAAAIRWQRRFATPHERTENLMAAREYSQHFDGPTTDDLIERRTASITPTQALFFMNSSGATRQIAKDIERRLNGDLLSILPEIYKTVLQRPVTEADTAIAKRFLEKRGPETDSRHATAEFIHLLLCSNEFIYLD